MIQKPESEQDRKQYWMNLTLAGAAGQVGCVTLLIVLGAILGGLWLDSRFDTRPMFTLILLIASIPISLVVMLKIVRLVTSKIKAGPPEKSQHPAEDISPGEKN
jgi:hypothetical protein